MTALYICLAIYFAIPIIAILISGRKLSVSGWIVFVIVWPIGWLIWGSEELP